MGLILPTDYIDVDFGKFKDCRIVMAEDASGVPREGIFIPFLQNFITKYTDSDIPHLMMKAFEVKKSKPGGRNCTHLIVPSCSPNMHDELVAAGLMSADQKYWSKTIGFIYRPIRLKDKEKK